MNNILLWLFAFKNSMIHLHDQLFDIYKEYIFTDLKMSLQIVAGRQWDILRHQFNDVLLLSDMRP